MRSESPSIRSSSASTDGALSSTSYPHRTSMRSASRVNSSVNLPSVPGRIRATHSSSTARRRSSTSSTSNPAREATVAAASRASTSRSAPEGMLRPTTSAISTAPRSGPDRARSSPGRRVDGREDGEDTGEAGDLEDLQHPGLGHDESQLSVGFATLLERPDQHPERSRVDERDAEEIDDHRIAPTLDGGFQLLPQ